MDIFADLQRLQELSGFQRRRYQEKCEYKIARYHPRFWNSARLKKLDEYGLRHLASLQSEQVLGRVDFPVVTGVPEEDFFATAVVERADSVDIIDDRLSRVRQQQIRETLAIVRNSEKCPELFFSVRLLDNNGDIAKITSIKGESFMLSLALAAISVIRERPVSDRWVCTGKIGQGGRVSAVGDITLKAELLQRERPFCTLILSSQNQDPSPRCFQVSSLKDLAKYCFPESSKKQISILKNKLFHQKKNWREIISVAEGLLEDSLTSENELLVLSSLLQGYNHTNQEESAGILVRQLQAFDFDDVDVSDEKLALANIGVHYVDILQPSLILKTLKKVEKATKRRNQAAIHLRGTFASCLMDSGKAKKSLKMYEKNLSITSRLKTETDIIEHARVLCDYADTLRRLGRYSEAEKYFQAGLQHLIAHPDPITEGFLLWHYGKLLIQTGRIDELPELEDRISREHFMLAFFLSSWKLYQATSETKEEDIQKELNVIAQNLGGKTILLKMFELRAKMLSRPSDEILRELCELSPEYNGLSWNELQRRLPY